MKQKKKNETKRRNDGKFYGLYEEKKNTKNIYGNVKTDEGCG